MRHQLTVSLALFSLLGGCGTTGMPTMGGTRAAPQAITGQSFAFQSARNADVEISVRKTSVGGDPDFLPGDPNWIQLDLLVRNAGNETVAFSEVQARLEDGRTLPSASSATELMKAPSYVSSTAAQVGLGTGGMMVGALLFPPAAIAAGLAAVFIPMFSADRLQARLSELNTRGLRTGPIAPDSYVSGLVFVPAVVGISGVTITYSREGAVRSIYLPRAGSEASPPLMAPDSTAEPANAPTHRIRTTATLRTSSSTSATALTVLRSPAMVTATGRAENEWLEVRTADGAVGWIYERLLQAE